MDHGKELRDYKNPLWVRPRRKLGCPQWVYSVEKLTFSLPADFRRLTNDTDNGLDGGN